MIERIAAIETRTKVFIVFGIGLLVLAATGVLQSSNDNEISKDQAIEIAEAELDFTPTRVVARSERQGFNLAPVWSVLFERTDDSGDDAQVLIVEVDARTGEVRRIVIDGAATEPDDS